MIEQKQRPRSQCGADKVSRIPIKVEPTADPLQGKPPWIKAKAPTSPRVRELKSFGERTSAVPTKSGLTLGLGESIDAVKQVLTDMRQHACKLLTLGHTHNRVAHICPSSVSSHQMNSTN
ncbi:MAG: lipoate synthase [Gammaproteobacteria bacterium]|jgi:lipoate synthase